jgi:hypothetical protein
MKDTILKIGKQNILLIGSTNSGKTFFVKNEIIPFLEKKWYKVVYFEDCNKLDPHKEANIFIVDEVEVLFDKDFLEKSNPEEIPYYNKSYLKTVENWQKKLSEIKTQIICIVTRNTEKEIDYVFQNYKKLEWNNLPVEIVKFARDKIILTD